jgi:outer membrane protein assembly factor BamB
MPNMQTHTPVLDKPLRLWPGVVIVLLQWLGRFGIPAFFPDFAAYGVLSAFIGALALLVWWLFFSRARWFDRLGAIAVMVAAVAATYPFLDVSISTGAMGFIFPMLAIPGVCLVFVLGAVASTQLPAGLRRPTMVAAIVLACGVWTLVRTGGFTGSFDNDLAWRWTPTSEQRLLAMPAIGMESFAACALTPIGPPRLRSRDGQPALGRAGWRRGV